MPDYMSLYEYCELCPRKCGVNRTMGEPGFCNAGAEVRAAAACLHKGEEPVLTGVTGSGTVFFSGCTLKCASCQNCQISQGDLGGRLTIKLLSEIFLELEKKGAANINLVTATHWIPGIAVAVQSAQNRGLCLPIVWNSSGFETEAMIGLLQEFVDIFLVDIKTLSPAIAADYLGFAEYPQVAKTAIDLMVEKKMLSFSGELLRSGVIIRHLLLPGHMDASIDCLRWIKEQYGEKIIVSVMAQYLPVKTGKKQRGIIDTMISVEEYTRIQEALGELEMENGFFQEFPDNKEWIPDFSKENPFPPEYSVPVWHYRFGFIV